jgi:elongation factor 1-beta
MASFADLNTSEGLQNLEKHLVTRSYISGYQASRDDLAVYSALSSAPSSSSPNAQRWYNHITALLGASFPGTASGVTISGRSAAAAGPAATTDKSVPAAGATGATSQIASAATAVKDGAASLLQKVLPAKPAAAAAKEDDDDEISNSDDDDEDLDLFGEMTPEEQKAAEEKKKIIEAAKARGAAKAKLTKSMVVLDVKPWDDTTDLAAMEAEVRAIHKDGLLWGKAQQVPIGYGIKKLQITAVIEDAKVESIDAICEEELVRDGESETIQSIDIIAFNKL